MADTAFKAAAFPGLTTAQLEREYAAKSKIFGYGDFCEKAQAELDRRYAVANGDVSVMTPGERLRFVKTGRA